MLRTQIILLHSSETFGISHFILLILFIPIQQVSGIMNTDVPFVSRYSFAIVGINMTDLVYSLLKKGGLRTHFYNTNTAMPTMEYFHEVYCKFEG